MCARENTYLLHSLSGGDFEIESQCCSAGSTQNRASNFARYCMHSITLLCDLIPYSLLPPQEIPDRSPFVFNLLIIQALVRAAHIPIASMYQTGQPRISQHRSNIL
jgi:hypothetical protein